MTVPVLLAIGIVAGTPTASSRADIPALLREIRKEVASLEKYPGEDFARGEFFLGEGDDDTNKTHAVGILVKEEGGGARMTLVVSRLEPARDDPRIKYARDPRTVICAFAASADGVEIVRSDYPAAELGKLLPAVLKAVLDKKALLKKSCFSFLSVLPSRGGEGIRLEDPLTGVRSGRMAGELEAYPEPSRREGRPGLTFL